MGLTDLPPELLMQLPQHLRNIQVFVDASSSCPELHDAFALTSPNTILRLAGASARTFFRPDPHFLVAATARQVSDWALLSPENTETLREAFRGGIEALYDLCLSKSGLTLDSIRRLHASRYTAINPVVDLIDRSAGQQWNAQPDFWFGGVSDAGTITVDSDRSLFQILIYGELFASTMLAVIEPAARLPRFDLDVRLDYIKYCIPDSSCFVGYEGMLVEKIGPYASYDFFSSNDFISGDQVGLDHILDCRRWNEAWKRVREEGGPDFKDEWRQKLWHSAVEMQGLEGLEMLSGDAGLRRWKPWLVDTRQRIEALDETCHPRVHSFGRHNLIPASDAPYLSDEIYVCVAGHWSGRVPGHHSIWHPCQRSRALREDELGDSQ